MRQRLEQRVERAVRSSPAGAPPRERQVMMGKAGRAPATTVATYRDDPLYPRIERAVTSLLAKDKVVAPVAVLVDMGLLAPEKLEGWRRGRVRYLEAVINSRKGAIAPGSDAVLVVFDPSVRKTLGAADLHGPDYSAWEGREVHGWPEVVMLRGTVVVDRGKLRGAHSQNTGPLCAVGAVRAGRRAPLANPGLPPAPGG